MSTAAPLTPLLSLAAHLAELVVMTDGTEAALDMARTGTAAVLAVGPDAYGTRRRAVVAMDFSAAALRAAELACGLLAPGGTLSLVYVKPGPEPGAGHPEWEAWDVARDRRVGELFQRLMVALRGAAGSREGRRDVTIGTATLVGDPADELIDYAARVGADLVAVGTRSAGAAERLGVGSVAEEVVRRAAGGYELRECSVLVSP